MSIFLITPRPRGTAVLLLAAFATSLALVPEFAYTFPSVIPPSRG